MNPSVQPLLQPNDVLPMQLKRDLTECEALKTVVDAIQINDSIQVSL